MSLLFNMLSRFVIDFLPVFLGFPWGEAGKESACNVGDLSLIPGLGRSSGEGKGYLLQYSGLKNSMNCIVHGAANSRTWLINCHFHFPSKEKASLISWLQSLSAVTLEPKKIKSVTISTFFPSIFHEVMGLDAMIFAFECEFQASFFTLFFHSHQEGLLFLFIFFIRVVSSA